MKILVINSGSSSIKYQLFDMDNAEALTAGIVEKIGETVSRIKHAFFPEGKGKKSPRSLASRTTARGWRRWLACCWTKRWVSSPSLQTSQPLAIGWCMAVSILGSMTALSGGKSIDTSMGFSPLAGLMMGTRSGDLDPAVVYFLGTRLDLSLAEIDRLLNKESGLLGISGHNDLRDIEDRRRQGDAAAQLALDWR